MILDRVASVRRPGHRRRRPLAARLPAGGAAAGGGLLLSLSLPFAGGEADAADADGFAPNAFVRIGGDGQVVLTMPYVEMGQGTYTSIPMLIAEELEVELAQVRLEHAPPDDKLYGNPLLAACRRPAARPRSARSGQPLRQAGATARTMLVAAAAQRWNVDPASCRAQERRGAPRADGQSARLRRARRRRRPPARAREAWRSSGRRISSSSARRPSGSTRRRRSTARRVYGIDARPPGVKIATLAQSPVFGGRREERGRHGGQGRQGRAPDRAARRRRRRRGRPHGGREEGSGGPGDRMGRRPARQAQHRRRSRDELEQATLGPGAVAQNDRRRRRGHGGRRDQGRGDLPGAVPRARHDGADELHRPRPQRTAARSGSAARSIARAQATAAKVTGLPLGQGRRPQSPDRRRLRPAAGGRRRHPRRPDRQAGRRPREGRLDARGRHPARHVPALLLRPAVRRARRRRACRSPGTTASPAPRSSRDGCRRRSRTASTPTPPRARSTWSTPCRTSTSSIVRVEPPGIPTAFWRSVGPSHNVFVTESFIDELAAAAKQDPVAYRRALLDKSPRAKAVLDLAAEKAGWGQPLPEGVGRGVSLQFAFGDLHGAGRRGRGVEGRRGPRPPRRLRGRLRHRRQPRHGRRRRSRAAIIFGITAALYGEITLKNGRVEQTNFDTYQMLRIERGAGRSRSTSSRARSRRAAWASPAPRRSSPPSPTRSSPRPASACASCRSTATR